MPVLYRYSVDSKLIWRAVCDKFERKWFGVVGEVGCLHRRRHFDTPLPWLPDADRLTRIVHKLSHCFRYAVVTSFENIAIVILQNYHIECFCRIGSKSVKALGTTNHMNLQPTNFDQKWSPRALFKILSYGSSGYDTALIFLIRLKSVIALNILIEFRVR